MHSNQVSFFIKMLYFLFTGGLMKHITGNVLESEIEISVGWNIIHFTAGKLIMFEWKAESIFLVQVIQKHYVQ